MTLREKRNDCGTTAGTPSLFQRAAQGTQTGRTGHPSVYRVFRCHCAAGSPLGKDGKTVVRGFLKYASWTS